MSAKACSQQLRLKCPPVIPLGRKSKCFADSHAERVAVSTLGNVCSEIDAVFLAEFESNVESARRLNVAIARRKIKQPCWVFQGAWQY